MNHSRLAVSLCCRVHCSCLGPLAVRSHAGSKTVTLWFPRQRPSRRGDHARGSPNDCRHAVRRRELQAEVECVKVCPLPGMSTLAKVARCELAFHGGIVDAVKSVGER